MSIEGVITMAEFKQRNDGFNKQAQGLEESLTALRAEMEKEQQTTARAEDIRRVLEQELSFQNGIDSALVTTILDKIVVKKGSTREKLYLDIYLKFGSPLGIVLDREKSSFCVNRSLTENAKGSGVWKAKSQAAFRDFNPRLCHYTVFLTGFGSKEHP